MASGVLTKAQLDELEQLARLEPTAFVRVHPAALLELVRAYREERFGTRPDGRPHVSNGFPKGFVRLRGREANGGVRCYYCGTRYFPQETEGELAARKAMVDAVPASEGAPPGVELGFDCESCRNGLPKLRAYWLTLSNAGP